MKRAIIEYSTKKIYIEFDTIYAIAGIIFLVSIILIAGGVGYYKGIKKSERQFMDKFVKE